MIETTLTKILNYKGCGYNADSLYNLAEYMQIPMMGCPAAGFGAAADRDRYSMTTRTSFTHKNTVNVFFRFCEMNGFRHVTVVQDDAVSFYEQMTSVFNTELRKRTDLIQTITQVPFRSRDATNEQYERLLISGNQSSRGAF